MPKSQSFYKGLTKIGQKFQVLIMIDKRKNYIGTYKNEEEAAKVYDKYSILVNGI